MAGIIYAPIAASLFIGFGILSPYIPALSLFTMPAILTFFAIFNLNIDWLNYWYSSAKLTSLQWWNILYAILCIIGVLPSFILVLPGFFGIILTFLLTPVWAALEILGVIGCIIFWYFDPSFTIFSAVLKWLFCITGYSTNC